MDPFQVEEASIPAVKSLRSKFEQLATPGVSAANNGKSSTKPAVPQRPGAIKERPLSVASGEAVHLLVPGPSSIAGEQGEREGDGSDGEASTTARAQSLLGESAPVNMPRNPDGVSYANPCGLRSSWSMSSVDTNINRPPPPTPIGIKRPPPPPPPQTSSIQRPRTPTSMMVPSYTAIMSTSPNRGGVLAARSQLNSAGPSPNSSPRPRPAPLPFASSASTPSTSVTGTPREGSPRPPSRIGLDESGDIPSSVSLLRHRFDDTSSKHNTPQYSSNSASFLSDAAVKPAIPPRPPKNSDAPITSFPLLLSTSPEPITPIPSLNITPPRPTTSSPFSDDETDDEKQKLTAPLVPTAARKPPPLPGGSGTASIRSFGSQSSSSSQASFDSVSAASSGSTTNTLNQRTPPPPPPPPRTRPKSSTLSFDTPTTPGTPSVSSKFPPPPLPSRRPTVPQSELESLVPSTVTPLPPPPRPASRSFPVPILSLNGNTKQDTLPPPSSPIVERKSLGTSKLPPPPMRTIALGSKLPPARRVGGGGGTGDSSDDDTGEEGGAAGEDTKSAAGDSFPDSSRSSRRPPVAAPFRAGQFEVPKIPIQPYGGHYVVGGSLVAVGHGYSIKIYDLSVMDTPMFAIDTKELGKVTCMEMKGVGEGQLGEGVLMWVGTKEGHVFEVDLRNGAIVATKQVTHMHSVTHVLRSGTSMVTLDEGGKALVFSDEGRGASLTGGTQPRVVRVTEKQDFVRMLGGRLWAAARTESQNGVGGAASSRLPIIRVYDLFSPGSTGKSVLPTEHVGAVTSATVLPSQSGKVFVGHEEGFVSIWTIEGTEDGYPKCVEVVKVSTSDVMCLEGVNDRLWVGSRNGTISAYDVAARPWVVTNSWTAHPGLPVLRLSVDVFGIDQGRLNVVSIGRDETMRFWDGLLGMDWIENEMQKMEGSYSSFRNVTTLIVSWNCDAARPDSLTGDPANVNLFSNILNSMDEPPDIIVFGFQEVIDLESRKMAAKNVLLGGAGKKKHNDEGVTGFACSGNGLSDKVTGAYRRWYERLVKEVRAAMPHVPYAVTHTESLVGLFSCIFIKASERFSLRDIAVTSVKRGMGGRYGNKGCIVARFVIGDSAICMMNCHLAAGQNAVRRRNADFAAILEEKGVFPPTEHPMAYGGGGDGSMILDHEIVFINGDLNYRIDHRREAIISSIRAGEFANLLTHDQLLREIKFNRGCRFRGFSEGQITFAPTYKYDPRSNEYDSSEKRRLPAWCDRVLWRARHTSRVEQLHYQRYEANVSDHRPVSAAFKLTIKTIQPDARTQVLKDVWTLWADEQARMLAEARKAYRDNVYL